MQTYGAEDAAELASILRAVDKALDIEDEADDRGPDWARVMQEPPHDVYEITALDIPTSPGVHVGRTTVSQFSSEKRWARRG